MRKGKLVNRTFYRTSVWYNGNLTTIDRAEILIRSIALHSKRDWNSKDLDGFVASMSEIFWPDKLFDRRAHIFVGDVYADNQHSENDNNGSTYCQRLAYNNCAIQFLAGVLSNVEKRYAGRCSLSQKRLYGTRTIIKQATRL